MSASESKSAIVLELAEEFLERYRQGQRPSLKEYIDRHPELADQIKEVFPAMALMENIALADESLAGVATGPATPAEATPPPQQLGDYRILREVGRGGMGIVYEAEQVSLGRHVALKVLPRQMFVDDAQRRRFEREAKAAAKLHHTNIVPVFGVGEHDGMPYYVMQFIQGLGLNDVLKELKNMQSGGTPIPQTLSTRGGGGQRQANSELPASGENLSAADVARSLLTGAFQDGEPAANAAGLLHPAANAAGSPDSSASGKPPDSFTLAPSSVTLPGSGAAWDGRARRATYWQSVAQIGIQVADALEYAHKQGIRHRDIKPSNLLLDTRGTVWVTDFGLARADNEEHLTQTGDIVGTLRYMPPEAFEGRADKRGDIYSLGLTLYELLALKAAFEERDRHRLIRLVTMEEPARLDALQPAIPRDLATIVHKAIDRDPERRYPTAWELAADLRRFLNDEPIQARRISSMERLARWCRHHPGVASLTAILVLLLVGITVASLLTAAYFDQLARREALSAESQRLARQEAVRAKDHEATLRGQAEVAKQQAEANFAMARKAVDDYFTTVSESQLRDVPGMQPLRRELLQSALTFYKRFLSQRGDDPDLRSELAASYLRLGWIYLELEEGQEARKVFEQARRLFEGLIQESSPSAEWQHGLAQCYRHLDRNDEAIALWQKLVRPGEPRFQSELADSYNHRALTYMNAGKHAEAMQGHQQALAIRELLVRLTPDDPNAQRDLCGTLNNIGVLLGAKGQDDKALAMFRRAAEHAAVAFARASGVILNGRSLAISQYNIARTERRLGHAKEALAAFQRAIEVGRKLAQDNPAVPGLHSELFRAYRTLALYQRELMQTEAAEQTMRMARERIDRLPNDGPDALFNLACVRAEGSTFLGEQRAEQKHEEEVAMETLRGAVAAGFRNLDLLRKAGELNALRSRDDFKALEADLAAHVAAAPLDKLKANQQVLTLRQKMIQADPTNERLRADLAATQHAIASVQLDLGRLEEARKYFEQAVALRGALLKNQPKNVQYQADCKASRSYLGLVGARQLVEQKRNKEAENALGRIEEFPSNDAQAYKERGRVYFALHQLDKAAADFRKAVELLDDNTLEALASAPAASGANKLFAELADDALLPRLTAAVQRSPEDADGHWKRGQSYARHRRWKEAAADFWTTLERNPQFFSDWSYLHIAPAVAAGDRDGYPRLCREMLKRFGDTQDPATAERVAKVCLLLSEFANERMEQACELADRAVARGKNHQWAYFFVFCKGLADYRRKNFRAAIDELGSLAVPAADTPLSTSRHLVLAMAFHQQREAKSAREHLAKAAKLLKQNLPDPVRWPTLTSQYHHDWLIAWLLHREAQTLIEGEKREPKK